MNTRQKILFLTLIALGLVSIVTPIYAVAPAYVPVESTTSDISDVVLTWMPLIIQFAMLGMILGLLKKFGKI